jgi:hypothetical protein
MDYCTAACRVDFWGGARPYFKTRLSDYDVWGVQKVYGKKSTNEIVGHRNQVVQVPGWHAVSGQTLAVWEFKNGTNEQWSMSVPPPYDRIGPLLASSLVWDTSGTWIYLNSNASASANQRFDLTAIEWRGAGNNCVAADNLMAGAAIRLAHCDGSATQKWSFINVDSNWVQVQLSGTSLCAASPVTVPVSGQDLALEACSSAGLRAYFQNHGSGGQMKYYYDTTKCVDTEWGDPAGAVLGGELPAPGKSLDTYDAGFGPKRDRRTLQVYTCKSPGPDKLNQQFHATGRITSVGVSGNCLDIAGGIGENGAGVQVYPCTTNPNQQWDFYFN